MSYTPTTWQNGDVITAEKLNHMEDGVANSIQLPENALLAHVEWDDEAGSYISDKTFAEMVSASDNYFPVYCENPELGTLMMTPVRDNNSIECFIHSVVYATGDSPTVLVNEVFVIYPDSIQYNVTRYTGLTVTA